MDTLSDRSVSLIDLERYLALGAGALLLMAGASRRSVPGTCLALSSLPLLYRGVTGRWPRVFDGAGVQAEPDSTQVALGGARGVHVRESIRLQVPVVEVYRFWRRLDNLPRFMTHLDSVTETSDSRSHWIAEGPGGLAVEWDAEIINEVENELLAWRSLPGSDVVTAGSVNFEGARDGRSTLVHVHMQYAPPAGKVGAFVASFFGGSPEQTIRENLQHFKHYLETGRPSSADVGPDSAG
jgi:uncharacterized membrane protein